MRRINWPQGLPKWVDAEIFAYLEKLGTDVSCAGTDIEFKDFHDYLGFKDRFAKWLTPYPIPEPVAMPRD